MCARGAGNGEDEETVTVTDAPRSGKSIWNLREGFIQTDAEPGDTAHITGDANTFLDENKPKVRLVGDIVENPYFRIRA